MRTHYMRTLGRMRCIDKRSPYIESVWISSGIHMKLPHHMLTTTTVTFSAMAP